MPYRLLKSFGLIAFYLAVTISKPELIRILQSNGSRVHEGTAIVHSPRILAIWTEHVLDRIGSERINVYFLRLLEYLNVWTNS